MISIDTIWQRIKSCEGNVFTQIRGKEFTYTIQGASLRPDTTNRALPKSQFEKAIEYLPFESTSEIQHLQGPSYIYAILMDRRIRKQDW